MSKNKIESTGSDNFRKELQDKIDGLRDKIDEKLPERTFFAILTILVLILLSVLGYLTFQVSALNAKYDLLDKRTLVIETENNMKNNK